MSSAVSRCRSKMNAPTALALAAILVPVLAVALATIGGWGNAGESWQVATSNLLTDDIWQILDSGTSALLPEYAFAQTLPVEHFVTTWRTSAANQDLTIPMHTGSTYNYTVIWGDGSNSTGVTGNTAAHTYATAGDYKVRIYGTFPGIHLDGNTDASKLVSIDQWGSNPWASMDGAFADATNMIYRATDIPDLSGVTNMYSNPTNDSKNSAMWHTNRKVLIIALVILLMI